MISEVKSARLLEGYRGGPAGDIEALKEALLRLSALVEALPEVAEFDLNPVKVLEPGSGLRVVDLEDAGSSRSPAVAPESQGHPGCPHAGSLARSTVSLWEGTSRRGIRGRSSA